MNLNLAYVFELADDILREKLKSISKFKNYFLLLHEVGDEKVLTANTLINEGF